MAYYFGLSINASSPGSSDVYAGSGLCLFVAATGATASAAVTYVNSATNNKWLIPMNPGTNSIWIKSSSNVPYLAYYVVRPEGYSGPTTTQLSTATTKTLSVSGTWNYKCPTSAFLEDLWADRQMQTTSWLTSDISSFTSYEDLPLCPASSVTNYQMYYGTGTTAWTSAQMGNRYACCSRLGFKTNWSTGFATYYTSKPATYTGYTVTVNSSTVSMTVNDEVQGYGSHSMRLIQVYAVTTGGTETLILAKPGATTVSFGLNTVSLGRQTTTVNGVKRFKMTFIVNGFNGVGATECAVGGVSSDVYGYTDGTNAVEMYTDDLTSNITISSSGTVDLILSTGY